MLLSNVTQTLALLRVKHSAQFNLYNCFHRWAHYGQVTVGAILGEIFFVFAFGDLTTLRRFEKEFSVKLIRGPSVRPNGSIDISQSETMSLSLGAYKAEMATERWTLAKRESKWDLEELVELLELPGVKFIRKVISEKCVEFEGKAVVNRNPRYSVLMTSTEDTACEEPTQVV